MQRQDEFLRTLQRIIELNRNGTPQHGYDLLSLAIAERLPQLKLVAYENHDLSSGLSWDGHIVCGDKASISRVKLALHYEEAYRPYPRLHRDEQEAHERTRKRAVRLLELVLRLSAENPAHVGSYRNEATELLTSLGIEPREGFFHSRAGSTRDALEKFK